ncbi:MAG TPA: hypothetical protein PKV72_02470 [Candidatus Peribacteria bacterium]|nr:hypothetical protein [Candidatus Peribacteria bacterium]
MSTAASIEYAPEAGRESLTARILKAPGRALGRFASGIARHPIQSALSLLGIGATLAGAHHLGLTQQLANLAPAGGFRNALNWPGAKSHRLATLGAERIGEQLPGVVTTPARAFLSATNGMFAPRP